MKKFILLLFSFYFIAPQVCANEIINNNNIYKKHDKEVQKNLHVIPLSIELHNTKINS